MTSKKFLRSLANGETDAVQILIALLKEIGSEYCVIGGLAVNAYADPVVSLDLDLVVISGRVGDLRAAAEAKGIRVQEFEHSVNLFVPGSDLRIQVQTDPRYQPFISRSQRRAVLGYEMSVAALEDVLCGKLWAFSDETRRKSKRQKDLSDIMRLGETHPELKSRIPAEIVAQMD